MKRTILFLISLFVVTLGMECYSSVRKECPLKFKSRSREQLTSFYCVKPIDVSIPRLTSEGYTSVGLVGNVISSKGAGRGMYGFSAASPITMNKLLAGVEFNGGGVYVNGKYYAQNYDYDSNYQLTMSQWYVYDAETWTLERTVDCPLDDFSYIAADRTYDPTTGTVYSITYDKDASGTLFLATTDLADGKSTLIGAFDKSVFCLAANAEGQLFAIDVNANLYSVDKTTAKLTLIANTNIFDSYESDYTQSATIDYATGKMYWAEFHTVGWFTAASALYEINTSTGATTKIADIPNNEEIVGLCVPDRAPAGSPAAVSGLAVNLVQGATQASFSFVLPTVTASGDALDAAESLMVEISVDSDVVDLVDGLPGESVTTSTYDFARGMHTVKVKVENGAGVGPAAGKVFFAGYDVPASVGGLKLTANGYEANLTWSAPTAGAQGGAIRGPITYEVIRMPGNVVVAESQPATSFSETLTVPALYSYVVTAITPDGRGVSAQSNAMVIADFGVPYSESFNTADAAGLFTIIDNNNDGKTWDYDSAGQRMRYTYGVKSAGDDWLITPGIRLEKGKSYAFAFKVSKEMNSYTETMEVYYGTSSDIASMTKIADITDLTAEQQHLSYLVPALADGAHYFAFKATSPANQYRIYVDDINVVEEGYANVPATINDLKVVAGAQGANEATVTFTAPSTTLEGSALESLTRIEIYRNNSDVPITTINSPACGSAQSWTDTSVKTGAYEYKVISYNEAGASAAATASVYVGIDVPGKVTDLTLTFVDGKPKLTWKAPAAGVSGGNLDGLVSYDVVRVANDVQTTVATALEATEFVDDWTVDTQAYLYYAVVAKTSAGSSDAAYTKGIVVGDPYPAPFAESFAGALAQNAPWSVAQVYGANGNWRILATGEYPYTQPQDADGGLASFNGYNAQVGNVTRLISPMIKIDHLRSPKLSFWMYHFNGNDGWHPDEEGPDYVKDQLVVEVSVDGSDYQELRDGVIDLYAPKNGWVEHVISLEKYTDSNYINIAFKGVSGWCYNIQIDNINVFADYVTEVSAVSLSGPSALKIGEQGTFVATVANNGSANLNNVAVRLKKDGKIVASKMLRSLDSKTQIEVELIAAATPADAGKTVEYVAEVFVVGDENTLNNVSKPVAVTTDSNELPVVTDLAAAADDVETGKAVTLTWSKPADAVIFDGVAAVADDCESYEPFSVYGFGNYIVVDGDGKNTYSVTDGSTYANKTTPKAFMVFNPSQISIPDYKMSRYQPYSGNQYLAAFSASTGVSDDWLIAPVPEGVTSFSFMARASQTRYGNEDFVVKYSTDGTSSSDFVTISTESVADEWTRFAYTLPEGAKYVAINYVSEDKFMFMVDDILLGEPAPEYALKGYNVYRNDVRINAEPLAADAVSTTDAITDDGTYVYGVTALYESGESLYSNLVTVEKQGGLSTIGAAPVVFASRGRICYSGVADTIDVYSTAGVLVASSAKANGSFAVAPGTYVVKSGRYTFKLIVY